jgi:hypothetical protein
VAAVDEDDDLRLVDVVGVGDRAAQRDLRRADAVGERQQQLAGVVLDLLDGMGAGGERVGDAVVGGGERRARGERQRGRARGQPEARSEQPTAWPDAARLRV